MRTSCRLAVPLFALLLLPLPAPAQNGAKVYKQIVPSVVWVHSTRPQGMATGTGTLVDKERRLILTNYHVVGENRNATVYFPVFRDGKPVAERDYYVQQRAQLGFSGRVIVMDKNTDLALIQLDKALPPGVEAVRLADTSPDNGSETHAIGNAGAAGALFGYVKGTVRGVSNRRWQAMLEPGRPVQFSARVIETDSPTNPGDSGGPLLNDRGELIGVTQGGDAKAQLVSLFIDISEVRKMMNLPAGQSNVPLNANVPRDPQPGPGTDSPSPTAPATNPVVVPKSSNRVLYIVGGIVLALLVAFGILLAVMYAKSNAKRTGKVRRRR